MGVASRTTTGEVDASRNSESPVGPISVAVECPPSGAEGGMMVAGPELRFELKRITPTEWLILDAAYEPGDARHTLACLHDRGNNTVEAIWVSAVALSTHYASPTEALEDVVRRGPGLHGLP